MPKVSCHSSLWEYTHEGIGFVHKIQYFVLTIGGKKEKELNQKAFNIFTKQ